MRPRLILSALTFESIMKELRREVSRVFAQQYLYSRVRISFQLRGVRRAKVSATLSNSTESVHLFTRAGSFTGGLTERQGRRSALGDKLRTVRPHAYVHQKIRVSTPANKFHSGWFLYLLLLDFCVLAPVA
jgi:hypothetical protein